MLRMLKAHDETVKDMVFAPINQHNDTSVLASGARAHTRESLHTRVRISRCALRSRVSGSHHPPPTAGGYSSILWNPNAPSRNLLAETRSVSLIMRRASGAET